MRFPYCRQSCPSSPPKIELYLLYNLWPLCKSYIHSLFDYGAPATCVASPAIQPSWERIQTYFISRALSIPSFIHNDRKRQHAYLPPIHDRNLYLAKRWYGRAMQHNHGYRTISTITLTTNATAAAAAIHHLN